MALPSFFATTTLRTLVMTTNEPEDRVRKLAESVRAELLVGDRQPALLAARVFVEMYSRSFGALRIVGPEPAVADLTSRAKAINPRVDIGSAVIPNWRVAVNTSAAADVTFTGAGWWVGAGGVDLHAAEGASPVGPTLAGIFAFNELFKLALQPALAPMKPLPIQLDAWSALDWQARAPSDEDLATLNPLHASNVVLVGCGAIGHAVAYLLGQVSHIDGTIDLVDPQPVSPSNLQRYMGTTKTDGDSREQKVVSAGRLLERTGVELRRHNVDWAAYRRRLERQNKLVSAPEILLVALDSAEDRRIVQGSLPRIILNGWTRIAECGMTTHEFVGDQQCLACTYLNPASQAPALHDVNRLVNELGLPLRRIIQLLAGASLELADLGPIERNHKLPAGSLGRWRGESLRPLYGELCGMANIEVGEREQYAVPLPQVSALAGTLVAGGFIKLASGLSPESVPLELSVIRGPGKSWRSPPKLKASHPAQCICKDTTYLDAYRTHWKAR